MALIQSSDDDEDLYENTIMLVKWNKSLTKKLDLMIQLSTNPLAHSPTPTHTSLIEEVIDSTILLAHLLFSE